MRSYEKELLAAEARVAEDRRTLESASTQWLRDKRDAAVSGRGLMAAVAAGFTLGGLFRKRPTKPKGRGGGLLTLVAGIAAAAIRARYGDPWAATSTLLLHRGIARATARPRKNGNSHSVKG